MRTALETCCHDVGTVRAGAAPVLSGAVLATVALLLSGCDGERPAVCSDPVDPQTLVTAKPTGRSGERKITHVCGQELVTPFTVSSARLQRRWEVVTIGDRCVAASDSWAGRCEDLGYLGGQIVRIKAKR